MNYQEQRLLKRKLIREAWMFLDPDFICEVVVKELEDVAEHAEEMYIRTAARILMQYYSVPGEDDGTG